MPRTKDCRAIFACLSEYLDGELSGDDCRKLQRHIKNCPDCAAVLRSLRSTIELCRNYRTPPPRARLSLKTREKLLRAYAKCLEPAETRSKTGHSGRGLQTK